MTAYYNEFDPKAAAWLRELAAGGHIAPGDVDERDIRDIRPDELRGYTQCHFFAGIGGWSLALRNAGWADDRPVWTGSCPCQPFSAAGKRGGTADERHLWPAFFHLIDQCRPPIVFGEQVASKDGLGWFDLVSADMEGSGYAVGAADLCAAGLGAPHIRQRLWFVGVDHTGSIGWVGRGPGIESGWATFATTERQSDAGGMEHATGDGRLEWRAGADGRGAASGRGLGGLADPIGERGRGGEPRSEDAGDAWVAGEAGGMGDPRGAAGQWDAGSVSAPEAREHGAGQSIDGRLPVGPEHASAGLGGLVGEITEQWPRPTNGFWNDADWLYCRDGKWRPVEPSAQQMVDGLPEGLGHLRLERDGEDESGTTGETGPDSALPGLWDATGAEALQREAGRPDGLQEAGLLRSGLHGAGLRGPDQGAERQELAATVGEGAETRVRAVRAGSASRPPQGLEPREQHADQPREPLRFLSQTGTPPPGCFPLANGVKHRVGLLRGYGNAIVPAAAQAFIEAYLDTKALDC